MALDNAFAPPIQPDDQALLRNRYRTPLSWLTGQPQFAPGGASFDQDFTPGQTPTTAWNYSGPSQFDFQPQMPAASGPNGLGATSQPEPPPPSQNSQGAARVLSRIPPPGATSQPQQAPAPSPAPRAAPTAPALPAENPRIAELEQKIAANAPPEFKDHWYQRLSMALLSATKLAPYAQQIVHPKYTEQMAAYQGQQQNLLGQLKAEEAAENVRTQGYLRSQEGFKQYQQGLDYQQREAERQAKIEADRETANQKANEQRVADLTKQYQQQFKGREEDIAYLPEGHPTLAQLTGQGYSVIRDARVDQQPGMPAQMIAVPPPFIQVTPDNLDWMSGHKVGDLVPWTEAKQLRQGYIVQQNEMAKIQAQTAARPPAGQVVPLEIGGQSHSVLVDHGTGQVIRDLGPTGVKPPVTNINADAGRRFQEAERGRGLLDKAEATYRGAARSADELVNFIDSAQAGNRVTAQAAPLEGTLAIVTSQGVKRINRTEVENIQGAGSLFDQIMGKVGKITAGQPLPPDIQQNFKQLADILKRGAYQEYLGAYQSAKKRYGLGDEEQPLSGPGGGAKSWSQQKEVIGPNGQRIKVGWNPGDAGWTNIATGQPVK